MPERKAAMFDHVTFRWQGIFFLIGAFMAYIFMRKDMKHNGYVAAYAEEMLLGETICGLLGGRLGWYLINGFDDIRYFFRYWDGRFDVLGAVLPCILFLFIYSRKNLMSFRRAMDCALPHVLFLTAAAYFPYIFSNIRMLLVVGVDALGWLLLEVVFRVWYQDKHRGDRAALALLWIGLSRYFIYIAEYGRAEMKLVMKLPGLITAIVGLILYLFNRFKKNTVKPLVLFDFDGTLMDTKAMVDESYRFLFNKYRSVDDYDDRTQIEVFGANDRAVIRKYFKNEDTTELTHEFRAFQADLPALGLVNTMPHALEVLMWLKKNGYAVGVVTSRPTGNCRMWIEEFDLEDYIDCVMGAEAYKKAKPAPDALRRICQEMGRGHDNCVYIGDHARDVRMGRRACVYAIGYLTSEKNEKRIARAKPNRTITDLLELEDILQETDHNWTYNLL